MTQAEPQALGGWRRVEYGARFGRWFMGREGVLDARHGTGGRVRRREKLMVKAQRDFLFVQSTTEQGGAETVLLNLFAASEALRRRAVVATLGFGHGDLPDRLRSIGAEVVQMDAGRLRYPWRIVRAVRKLAGLARERQIDVIVGNGAHPQVFAGLAARLAGVRSAYMLHTIHSVSLLANHLIDILAIRGPCDLVIANSEASAQPMRRLRPGLRVGVVHPGTAIASVSAASVQETRRSLGISPAETVFGIFGRVQRGKGQDLFVEAAASVGAAIPSARFIVVGGSVFGLEPEYLPAVQRRAVELGLGSRVTFTGQRSNVPELMAACDAVVHATRTAESFGMVVIEAMAQGRAVIATTSGGPREIVENGVSGILVRPDNPGDLADAMVKLGKDPALRQRMGAAALERVHRYFTSAAMAERQVRQLEILL